MGLSSKIVDLNVFCGVEPSKDVSNGCGIGEIGLLEREIRVRQKMADATSVRRGGSARQTNDCIVLFKKELGKVRSILTRDAGDYGGAVHYPILLPL